MKRLVEGYAVRGSRVLFLWFKAFCFWGPLGVESRAWSFVVFPPGLRLRADLHCKQGVEGGSKRLYREALGNSAAAMVAEIGIATARITVKEEVVVVVVVVVLQAIELAIAVDSNAEQRLLSMDRDGCNLISSLVVAAMM